MPPGVKIAPVTQISPTFFLPFFLPFFLLLSFPYLLRNSQMSHTVFSANDTKKVMTEPDEQVV